MFVLLSARQSIHVTEADSDREEEAEDSVSRRMDKLDARDKGIQRSRELVSRQSAEPDLLRVCRLMRTEGMKSYYQFLQAEKKRLTKQAMDTYSLAEGKIMVDPINEWLVTKLKLWLSSLTPLQMWR